MHSSNMQQLTNLQLQTQQSSLGQSMSYGNSRPLTNDSKTATDPLTNMMMITSPVL